jgi:CRISPR system Cascade subunit CasC
MAKEISPQQFRGERTRLMFDPLVEEMKSAGLSVADAEEGAKKIIDSLVKLDGGSTEKVKSKSLYFMSPLELQTLAKTYAETKDTKKALKAVKPESLKDAADISIFGRMVANDHTLTVEAASMFSHALSTHNADNEIDFFSAVDDLQPKEESGAGMTSTLEFNSATYYRFAALNLDMLGDTEHLGSLTKEELRQVVLTFLEATIKAIPGARKNTMNGYTLPVYVLGVVREKGHPVQLVNAFENPVRSSQGYVAKSVEQLKSEYAKLNGTWGIEAVFEKAIPDVDLKTFLDGMVNHAF